MGLIKGKGATAQYLLAKCQAIDEMLRALDGSHRRLRAR